MNKNIVNLGYVAVGALLLYLLLRKDKSKQTISNVEPAKGLSSDALNNQNIAPSRPKAAINDLQVSVPKEKSQADYEKEFSAMTLEQINKLIPQSRSWDCKLPMVKLRKPDYEHAAFLKELSKRGLLEKFYEMPC